MPTLNTIQKSHPQMVERSGSTSQAPVEQL
jgi:hypothetical protein